jgi:hypothetical protein
MGKINSLKNIINSNNLNLIKIRNSINVVKPNLNQLLNDGLYTQYSRELVSYSNLESSYNKLLNLNKIDISSYNSLIKQYNSLVFVNQQQLSSLTEQSVAITK